MPKKKDEHTSFEKVLRPRSASKTAFGACFLLYRESDENENRMFTSLGLNRLRGHPDERDFQFDKILPESIDDYLAPDEFHHVIDPTVETIQKMCMKMRKSVGKGRCGLYINTWGLVNTNKAELIIPSEHYDSSLCSESESELSCNEDDDNSIDFDESASADSKYRKRDLIVDDIVKWIGFPLFLIIEGDFSGDLFELFDIEQFSHHMHTENLEISWRHLESTFAQFNTPERVKQLQSDPDLQSDPSPPPFQPNSTIEHRHDAKTWPNIPFIAFVTGNYGFPSIKSRYKIKQRSTTPPKTLPKLSPLEIDLEETDIEDEVLETPLIGGLPADLFLHLMTSPIKAMWYWFIATYHDLYEYVSLEIIEDIPMSLCAEIDAVIHGFLDSVLYEMLDYTVYQYYVKKERIVGDLVKNFLLAAYVLRHQAKQPEIYPFLMSDHNNYIHTLVSHEYVSEAVKSIESVLLHILRNLSDLKSMYSIESRKAFLFSLDLDNFNGHIETAESLILNSTKPIIPLLAHLLYINKMQKFSLKQILILFDRSKDNVKEFARVSALDTLEMTLGSSVEENQVLSMFIWCRICEADDGYGKLLIHDNFESGFWCCIDALNLHDVKRMNVIKCVFSMRVIGNVAACYKGVSEFKKINFEKEYKYQAMNAVFNCVSYFCDVLKENILKNLGLTLFLRLVYIFETMSQTSFNLEAAWKEDKSFVLVYDILKQRHIDIIIGLISHVVAMPDILPWLMLVFGCPSFIQDPRVFTFMCTHKSSDVKLSFLKARYCIERAVILKEKYGLEVKAPEYMLKSTQLDILPPVIGKHMSESFFKQTERLAYLIEHEDLGLVLHQVSEEQFFSSLVSTWETGVIAIGQQCQLPNVTSLLSFQLRGEIGRKVYYELDTGLCQSLDALSNEARGLI